MCDIWQVYLFAVPHELHATIIAKEQLPLLTDQAGSWSTSDTVNYIRFPIVYASYDSCRRCHSPSSSFVVDSSELPLQKPAADAAEAKNRRVARKAAFFEGIRETASAAFSMRRLLLGKEAGPLAHGYTF